ncbi:UBP-type zinc finger domain-containing protein [Hymenobacter coalescens]
MQPKLCAHLGALAHVTPATTHVCAECLALGDTWVHLRVCQECGHVGCCDDSKNKHATQHYHATQHPVVASAEPGERWLWCFADRSFAQY